MARSHKTQAQRLHTEMPTASPKFMPVSPVQAKRSKQKADVPEVNLDSLNYLANPLASMFGHGSFAATLPMQPKLTVGAVGDKYEQEADQVAAQVVNAMHSPAAAEPAQRETVQREGMEDEEEELQMKPATVQREGMEDEEEELQMKPATVQREGMEEDEEEELQMKPLVQRVGAEGGAVSDDFEQQLQSAKGSGQALDAGLQTQMGQAMGADFSGVKVHTDSQSDQLNQSIQAKAFTTGQDVFFSQGAYNPSSKDGQELIAHELTHVVQQSGAGVQKKVQPKIVNISSAPSASHQPAINRMTLGGKKIESTSELYDSLVLQHGLSHSNEAVDAFNKIAETKQDFATVDDLIVAIEQQVGKSMGGGGFETLNGNQEEEDTKDSGKKTEKEKKKSFGKRIKDFFMGLWKNCLSPLKDMLVNFAKRAMKIKKYGKNLMTTAQRVINTGWEWVNEVAQWPALLEPSEILSVSIKVSKILQKLYEFSILFHKARTDKDLWGQTELLLGDQKSEKKLMEKAKDYLGKAATAAKEYAQSQSGGDIAKNDKTALERVKSARGLAGKLMSMYDTAGTVAGLL
jgi:hypothetical protein